MQGGQGERGRARASPRVTSVKAEAEGPMRPRSRSMNVFSAVAPVGMKKVTISSSVAGVVFVRSFRMSPSVPSAYTIEGRSTPTASGAAACKYAHDVANVLLDIRTGGRRCWIPSL